MSRATRASESSYYQGARTRRSLELQSATYPSKRSHDKGLLPRWRPQAPNTQTPEGLRRALVRRIVGVARRLREDDLILTVLRAAPELAMVYIADRLGTSQQVMIDVLAEELRKAQHDNSVRCGDPRRLAATVLLITQSVVQSGQIVAPILDAGELDVELSHALNGYLAGSPDD